jgi:hypothetical protein
MRRKLEALQLLTGAKTWAQIFRSQRIAGRPRSVTAAIQVVLMTDFVADTGIDKKSRKLAGVVIESFKTCAAYREIAWLDQKQLKKYISEFRANDYQEPSGYKWIENRE